MTSRLALEGAVALRGTAVVPGDKSISHRALMLAALAGETSHIRNLSPGHDVQATRRLIEELGCLVEGHGGGLRVLPGVAVGARALAVDCGNSGTTMRLGLGLLAGFGRTSLLWGDDSLSHRPMSRVLEPLAAMGASVWSVAGHAPVAVEGGSLKGIDFTPERPSAQVKSAILLAGMNAEGETTVRESVPTRPHTEEMLRQAGAAVSMSDGCTTIRPGNIDGLDVDVPGDPSAAAFWVVAASIVPQSRVRVHGIYLGPGRTEFLAVLGRMGADVEVTERGENRADLEICHAALAATDITDPAEVAACVDELPVLAVAAAFATGTTVIKGAQELRVKESDRLAALTEGLRAFGVQVEPSTDGLTIEGRGPRGLRGARVDSHKDHRIAMAFAVAGLGAQGRTEITEWDSVAVSDPGFEGQLARLVAA